MKCKPWRHHSPLALLRTQGVAVPIQSRKGSLLALALGVVAVVTVTGVGAANASVPDNTLCITVDETAIYENVHTNGDLYHYLYSVPKDTYFRVVEDWRARYGVDVLYGHPEGHSENHVARPGHFHCDGV
jgi:hypothetical protein